MKINTSAVAGTLESSDVYVELEPAEGGIQFQLESVVLNQFGESIEATVRSVLEQFNIESAKVNFNTAVKERKRHFLTS